MINPVSKGKVESDGIRQTPSRPQASIGTHSNACTYVCTCVCTHTYNTKEQQLGLELVTGIPSIHKAEWFMSLILAVRGQPDIYETLSEENNKKMNNSNFMCDNIMDTIP